MRLEALAIQYRRFTECALRTFHAASFQNKSRSRRVGLVWLTFSGTGSVDSDH